MVRGSATPAAIEGLSTVTEVDAGSAAPAVTVMVFAAPIGVPVNEATAVQSPTENRELVTTYSQL